MEDDFPRERIVQAIGANASALMEAMEVAEVQEAILDWTEATTKLIRSLQRADIDVGTIAGWVSAGGVELLRALDS